MELYNFFTELTADDNKIQDLKLCLEELKPICHHVSLVVYKSNECDYYSIIGQMLGEDSPIGDSNLFNIFTSIEYTWFDAFTPIINNLKQ